MPLLVVDDLRFAYRRQRRGRHDAVVDGISFSLDPGEMIGLLGANGAGKSTVLKLIAGILTPARGRVSVGGIALSDDRSRFLRSIGVLFGQKTQLWWDLPLIDTFHAHRHMYGLASVEFREALTEVVEALAIEDLLEREPRRMSLGQRVRSDIAVALLHRPDLLLLDEPSLGLDAASRRRLFAYLDSLTAQGMGVVVTSHEVADIEALARRVILLEAGQISFDGGQAGFYETAGLVRALVVEFTSSDAMRNALAAGPAGVTAQVVDDRTLAFSTAAAADLGAVISALDLHSSSIAHLRTVDPDLATAMLRFTDA